MPFYRSLSSTCTPVKSIDRVGRGVRGCVPFAVLSLVYLYSSKVNRPGRPWCEGVVCLFAFLAPVLAFQYS